MKSILFSVFCLVTLYSCDSTGQKAIDGEGTLPSESPATIFEDLTVEQFKAKMADPDVVVLDVRTPAETEKGKIEGAIEIDFKADGFEDEIDKLDKEKTYLVYCRTGVRSGKTCKFMRLKGFKTIYNLEGGYRAWSKE